MMKCRIRRRSNFVTIVSCTLLLTVFASTAYIHVHVLIAAVPQYVNFTTSTAAKVDIENGTSHVKVGVGNGTSDLFGNYFLALISICTVS